MNKTVNLDTLLNLLHSQVTPHWYQFGQAAGIAEEVLKKILDYPSDVCLAKVIDHWLKHHYSAPTWKDVAKVLKKIGLSDLAYDILHINETGRL